ncbi:MAG TPA: PAS domain S-box protein [Candidatus Acidoferrales bacterium]|nr:PAS domain S-box protein [Candidatus Acidoferrales bacterium]
MADALRTLELNEARWQAVLDTARDAIISIDQTGKITLFNQEAERIFGYPASEVVGQNVRVLMPAPYHDEHDNYLRNYQETGIKKAIGRIREVWARRKDGEVFPIELSVSAARVGGDAIYSAIIRDVAERQRTQAQLLELQRLAQQRERLADIGAITAKIVHDLGNPLAGLSMQSQLILRRLQRGDLEAASVRDSAERIQSAVERLMELVDDFKTFAREQGLKVKSVKLPAFLGELAEMWRPIARLRDIDLSVRPDDVDELQADEAKLHRVFDNLVKNAIEAVDHGPGQVGIDASSLSDRLVRINVTDTGPGIPEGTEIFRLFETTKRDGTGLGLAVAKQIVLAHGGTIGFTRLRPTGTVFHVDLLRHGPPEPRTLVAGGAR